MTRVCQVGTPMCNSNQDDKPTLIKRLAQAQGMTRNVFVLSALRDAIKMIDQLTWEINAVSDCLDMERKKRNGLERPKDN